jgi:hypothetical protein
MAMSLGLILEICFVWSILLAAIGLVLINLSINMGQALKRTRKTSEQGATHETKNKMKAPIWKLKLDGTPAVSIKYRLPLISQSFK